MQIAKHCLPVSPLIYGQLLTACWVGPNTAKASEQLRFAFAPPLESHQLSSCLLNSHCSRNRRICGYPAPIRGPGYFNLDLSLSKIVTFREQLNLEIRGESFGITNTAHLTLTQNNLTSGANFGHVTSTLSGDGGGRTMQLSMKLTF